MSTSQTNHMGIFLCTSPDVKVLKLLDNVKAGKITFMAERYKWWLLLQDMNQTNNIFSATLSDTSNAISNLQSINSKSNRQTYKKNYRKLEAGVVLK